MTQTINEAKHILSEINSIEVLEQHELNQDVRKGIQQAITRRRKTTFKRTRNFRPLQYNE